MRMVIQVPTKEFYHYSKYLLPAWRYVDTGINKTNLLFKSFTVIPSHCKKPNFPRYSFASTELWKNFQRIAKDCPPNDFVRRHIYLWITQQIYYQHWTRNAKETYEQLVGDECYQGINGE